MVDDEPAEVATGGGGVEWVLHLLAASGEGLINLPVFGSRSHVTGCARASDAGRYIRAAIRSRSGVLLFMWGKYHMSLEPSKEI
jgi:hypothetical protein